MDLVYGQLSSTGPVREKNEDYLQFHQPERLDERRGRGAIAVLADGVGGHHHGEIASRLAVDAAIKRFEEIKAGTSPQQTLWKMFTSANLAVYDYGMDHRDQGRMATTLTISLFRNNEVTIGHVGDCRAYIVQGGSIRRLTADHSYVATQVKLGLLTEEEAATSEMRSILTRSIGKEPTVQVDYYTAEVNRADCLVQCSDGLYQCVTEPEILEAVSHHSPEEACKELVGLAEKRGTEDNLSVQVVQIQRVERLVYYRGVPVYQEAELPRSNEVEVGQMLDDRFHIVGVVSRSGMASIFRAVDSKSGQAVALKVPFMQFESDPAFFSRFEREETIGKTLDHPSILHILPVENKSRPYIAMEFLEGQTLRQAFRGIAHMPIPESLAIASRICDAVAHMHERGVVHRDLKPENVMLCHDGSLRIMDFGIAKASALRRLTFTGFTATMGTPDYMAPEQVKGKRGDERTDIYSLGAMLYEMVTGSPPFEGGNAYAIMNARLSGDPVAPRKRNPEVSPQVEEIILHAMERNPADRYASAAAMKADLDAPDSVPLTGRHERLRPPVLWRTRWRALRITAVAVLVPFVVFGLMLLFYRVLGSPR